uniref:Capsid protein n=1 Tax=Riboviria sp. TaxID=2585031 RepID=A0A8K1JF54_9VIRU|nr:MAG: putative protein [Riboviria sp.]
MCPRKSNSLGKVLSSVLGGGLAPARQRSNNKPKRRPGKRGGRAGRGWTRALPASYATHVKSSFRIRRVGDGVRVVGSDLVTPLPATITTLSGTQDLLFSVITANPLYWTGTRIAQFGAAYMNYRPISLVFRYIPQVAVTQAGTVVMGTLWNGASPSGDLQQTLLTSNGGSMINCYVPANTRVKLGSNLQQNLFTCCGDLNPDTSPFLFVAIARGCTSGSDQVVPGYFYVDYVYDFKNPIGQAWTYRRTDQTAFSDLTYTLPNRSIVLLEQMNQYGPGTIFDVEQNGTNVSVLYHGTPITMEDDTLVQLYENGQNAAFVPSGNEVMTSYSHGPSGPFEPIPWVYEGTVTAANDSPILRVSSTTFDGRQIYQYSVATSGVVTATSTQPAANIPIPVGEDYSLWIATNLDSIEAVSSGTFTRSIYGPKPGPTSSASTLLAKIETLQARLAQLEAQDADAAVVPLYSRKPATN